MTTIFAVLGAIIGAVMYGPAGFVLGIILGYLLAAVLKLRGNSRVDQAITGFAVARPMRL